MKVNFGFEAPAGALVVTVIGAYACITGFRKLIVEAAKLESAEESTEEKPE